MESVRGHRVDPPLPPLAGDWQRSARRSYFSWTLLITAAALALTLKFFGPASFRIIQASGFHSLEDSFTLLAALFTAIACHEAGHLAMARALDFDVLGGSFGPVRAVRLHRVWSFQLSSNLFSGSVIAIPRDEQNWQARMLAVVSAGPLATFLSGLAAGVLFLSSILSNNAVNRFLGAFVELNFLLFVLGLFPNSPSVRLPNDARLFFSLLRNTAEANEILLYQLMVQLQIAGMRPRDYPERVIQRLARAGVRPEMCFVFANAILLWAIDREDLRTAAAWEKRALDASDFCDVKLQNSAQAASACFDLIFRNDVRAARGKFAEVQLTLLSPSWLRHRAAAAYLLAAGNVPSCLAEIARARYAFPNRLPYYDFERMLLTSLYRKAIALEPEDLVSRSLDRVSHRPE